MSTCPTMDRHGAVCAYMGHMGGNAGADNAVPTPTQTQGIAPVSVPTLADLPHPLLHAIASELSIFEWLWLERTCRSLRGYVRDDGPLWHAIAFTSVGTGTSMRARQGAPHPAAGYDGLCCAVRLTDEMLAALLRKVNAAKHTRSLSLRFCTQITGTGLQPLTASALMLQEIDLRTAAEPPPDIFMPVARELNSIAIARVLTSLLPLPAKRDRGHRLTRVRFAWEADKGQHLRALTGDLWHSGRIERVRRLRQLEAQRPGTWDALIASNRTRPLLRSEVREVAAAAVPTCGHLEDGVVCRKLCSSESRPCAMCAAHSCAEGDHHSHDCCLCARVVCARCDHVGGPCSACGKSFCGSCRLVWFCAGGCSREFCIDCDKLNFCEQCGEHFCHECRRVAGCDSCGETFCDVCRVVTVCAFCSRPFCDHCRGAAYCGTCGQHFCAEHSGMCMCCTRCRLPRGRCECRRTCAVC